MSPLVGAAGVLVFDKGDLQKPCYYKGFDPHSGMMQILLPGGAPDDKTKR